MVTKLVKGTKVKVKSYPKCSASCKETCAPCVVNAEGKCTGRFWTPSVGLPLYEVKYKKSGIKKHLTGVFTEKELELINE